MAGIFRSFSAEMFDDHRMAIERLKAAELDVYVANNDPRSYRTQKTSLPYGMYDATWLTALPVQDLKFKSPAPNGSWKLSNWMCMPTSCVHEIMCVYPSLARAVDSLLTYHFGQPTVINGWVCPLHRHPELPESKVRGVLPSAVPVTADQFTLIKQEGRARFWADVAACAPPSLLQWDEERRTAVTACPKGGENFAQLDDPMMSPERKPTEGPLPPGLPPNFEDVSSPPYWEFMIRSQFVPIRHAEDSSRTLCLRRDLQEAYIICLREGVRQTRLADSL